MHDLTREDIEIFARENLQSYVRYADFELKLFNELVRDIVDKAQGVFFWVRLVVRSLRDGITNEDPVSLLQERLRAIPSDLEEFFEQILASVDLIYRKRMANTFLATLRSDAPLRIIHYYFLEHEDPNYWCEAPMQWSEFEIQRRVQQTQRRLNGRFKGLSEPASTININSKTTIDFLHRTLRDFLIQGSMRKTVESWADQEIHVLTSVSHTFIAESKFINHGPTPEQLKLAVELAQRANEEMDQSIHLFKVLDQVELEFERQFWSHVRCQSIGLMLRAAVSIGHTEYVRYRLAQDGAAVNTDHLLSHAMACPLDPDQTFSSCVQLTFDSLNTNGTSSHCFVRTEPTGSINDSPQSAMVKLLLNNGADPTVMVNGATSALEVFLSRMDDKVDLACREHIIDIFHIFLDRKVLDTKTMAGASQRLLARKSSMKETAAQSTL